MTPMSPEYIYHATALENFRQALIAAEANSEPIPFDVCIPAWTALLFAFSEMVGITHAADAKIDQLQHELGIAALRDAAPVGMA